MASAPRKIKLAVAENIHSCAKSLRGKGMIEINRNPVRHCQHHRQPKMHLVGGELQGENVINRPF